MKRGLFIMLSGLLFFASCKKTDDNSSNVISPSVVNTTVVSGTWRVTYYFTDHDATANFTGYIFTFAVNGSVTASKNGSTVTGTWLTGTDDSTAKFILNFSSPSLFQSISEDWHVIERTDNRLKLQHVSGGNGGTSYLTFEKN